MLKHLKSFSDYEVEYVTENEFYAAKDGIDTYVESFLGQSFKIVSN